MKKLFSYFLVAFIILNPMSIMANDSSDYDDQSDQSTRGPVCEYVKSYSETIDDRWEEIQFRHTAEKGSLDSAVTHAVETTSSLQITGGYEGELNFLLANSKVNFELSYTGERTVTTSITWTNIPPNETHELIAGKKMVALTGKITTRQTDCSTSTDTISVEGSVETFHTSYRIE